MLKTYWTFYENILKFKNLIMSKKGLVTLTAAYLAGVAAATFYGRNGKQLKKDLEKAEEEGNSKLGVVLCAFIETHKNMINSLKEEIMSEKNIELYNKCKDEALKIFDSYKEKGKELMAELKEKGADYASKTYQKLEELYNSKIFDLENIKGISAKTLEELKAKLASVFKSTKDEIEEEIEKSKKHKKDKKN
ncbi:hypothetical protein BLD25_05080 [Candidatus Gracilibacteria bacterium GN02-872]|nr:hypothetical protein BLD25_05080 [Candidatus Gracilibacteria bacterium GN02-872]RKW24367.1 MAG: hypothetical protein D8B46_01660 [Candidatus Gracilibacteria bacterium]